MLQSILDFLKEFGALGLFIHSFADAVIFPVPAFFLQVSLSLAHPSTAIWLATVGYIGSLVGTPFGYLIGKAFGSRALYKVIKSEWIDTATTMFQKNGEAAILIGSFTPIPFKVFTILSGCFNFPLWRLIAYAALGRAVKFYVVGVLFYLYGQSAEGMVKDVTFKIFIISVPILFLGLIIKRKLKDRLAKRSVQQQTIEQLAAVQEELNQDTQNIEENEHEKAEQEEAELKEAELEEVEHEEIHQAVSKDEDDKSTAS